jgi:hypothetical protein
VLRPFPNGEVWFRYKLIRTATSLRLRNRINIFVTTNKNIFMDIIYMMPLEIIIKIHSRAKLVRYINT